MSKHDDKPDPKPPGGGAKRGAGPRARREGGGLVPAPTPDAFRDYFAAWEPPDAARGGCVVLLDARGDGHFCDQFEDLADLQKAAVYFLQYAVQKTYREKSYGDFVQFCTELIYNCLRAPLAPDL